MEYLRQISHPPCMKAPSTRYPYHCHLFAFGFLTGGLFFDETPRSKVRLFTPFHVNAPDEERFLQALYDRFLYFALISNISPQKSSNIHAIYQ